MEPALRKIGIISLLLQLCIQTYVFTPDSLFAQPKFQKDFWKLLEVRTEEKTLIRSIIATPSGHIFLATIDDGVHRSTDNGITWTKSSRGLTVSKIISLISTPTGHIFAGTLGGGVFRSTDGGSSWSPINNGIRRDRFDAYPPALCLASTAAGDLFVYTYYYTDHYTRVGALYRSADNGETWVEIYGGKEKPNIITLASSTSGYLFAGTRDGLIRSGDNGVTWEKILAVPIELLAIHPTGNIFAGTQRSTDNGTSWSDPTYFGEVKSLAINSAGHLFVAIGGEGCFRSLDGGKNWIEINSGFKTKYELYGTKYEFRLKYVEFLACNPAGYLFCVAADAYGVRGRIVFRSSESTLRAIEERKEVDAVTRGLDLIRQDSEQYYEQYGSLTGWDIPENLLSTSTIRYSKGPGIKIIGRSANITMITFLTGISIATNETSPLKKPERVDAVNNELLRLQADLEKKVSQYEKKKSLMTKKAKASTEKEIEELKKSIDRLRKLLK